MPSSPFRNRRGRRVVRLPGALGCLVALVALPLALLAAVVAVARALLGRSGGAEGAAPRRPRAPTSPADVALCDFVRKMSLDETFDAADAATAGLPLDRDVTVDGLVDAGLRRGWIERRDGRYAVTERGREESARQLEQRGL